MQVFFLVVRITNCYNTKASLGNLPLSLLLHWQIILSFVENEKITQNNEIPVVCFNSKCELYSTQNILFKFVYSGTQNGNFYKW